MGKDGKLHEMKSADDIGADGLRVFEIHPVQGRFDGVLDGPVLGVDAGNSYCYILFADGRLVGAGGGDLGEIGSNRNLDHFLPMNTFLPPGVQPVALSCGYFHVGVVAQSRS